MSYVHSDINIYQQSKIQGNPCGDVVQFYRDIHSTIVVLADGLGSGLKANISATLICTRLIELIKNGFTLREAFFAGVNTMNQAWGTDQPFAVFTIARILVTGRTTVLSYEMPPPLLFDESIANIMIDREFMQGKAVITESNFRCNKGESIVLVSDGIIQAGLGQGLPNGWGTEGLTRYINRKLSNKSYQITNISKDIVKHALKHWIKKIGDDCTAVHIKSRVGIIVNILTGPPENYEDDKKFVKDFINQRGIKIICGGTTSKIVSKELRLALEIKENSLNDSVSPASYKIDGINLVTEGIVTLNHVYNLIDEDTSKYIDESDVYEFCEFLKLADRVNFLIGHSTNKDMDSIQFRQQRILPRNKIIPLLIRWLEDKGKLVDIKYY
jgi:hypothetical protein